MFSNIKCIRKRKYIKECVWRGLGQLKENTTDENMNEWLFWFEKALALSTWFPVVLEIRFSNVVSLYMGI